MTEIDREKELERWRKRRRVDLLVFAILLLAGTFINYYLYGDILRFLVGLVIVVIGVIGLDWLLKVKKARIEGEKPKMKPLSKTRIALSAFTLAWFFYMITLISFILASTPNYFVIFGFFLIGVIFTIIGIYSIKKK